MDNNKPDVGQHQARRGRGEEVGINDERRGWVVGSWRLRLWGKTDRQAGRQSCHETESERNQEEALLYRVPQCEICQPQSPHTDMDLTHPA